MDWLSNYTVMRANLGRLRFVMNWLDSKEVGRKYPSFSATNPDKSAFSVSFELPAVTFKNPVLTEKDGERILLETARRILQSHVDMLDVEIEKLRSMEDGN
jgi:hypothetical protein